MATIVNTLIQGLTQQMVQARLNTADATPFLFGTHFPVKKVNGFNWKTLQNQLEKKNVAADLHTDNGTIIRKRRPVFESARGDIPFISISRELSRSEIKDYQTALAFAQDDDATKLVQYWGNDVDFCFNGVQSELEYIAWKLASNAGVLKFTTTTNATYANEFDLDYDVDPEMKVATASDWSNKTTADIIGDLVTIIKAAKAQSLNPKFAFVNLDEFYKIASADQIIKACASFASNALGISQTPDLAAVNSMLARQAWLNGIQLRVIDQTITREFTDGTSTSGNPFENSRLILSESERLGSTQYDILQEDEQLILRAERAHTIIKKYGTIEPKSEVTIGQADAIPVFDTAYKNVYVKTDAKAWE
ncbi:MAG: major capsid protein [Bacteroidales bacterium]|nr:major capsid protein [Bacteroidales bacterium]